MEAYYLSFKENRSITAEAQFECGVKKCPSPPEASCPLFRPLHRTMRASEVITLATKTDKDAPISKRPKVMVTELVPHLPCSPAQPKGLLKQLESTPLHQQIY
ncbi:hypothetical protein HAX54_001205 [Datura stramonium]|uniref:Uncharacterized protein n=1 Tax=Datura stramonium TaxID=4076 RepID=A0ABS8WUA7_DATST|nr:hypothetical protein [Datura stramonium]